MKNLLFLALIFSVSFIACGDDEDDTPTDAELIVGVWDFDSATAVNCDDPDNDSAIAFGPDSCIEFFGLSLCFEGTMTFDADGTATQEIISTITEPDGSVSVETETSVGTYEFTDTGLTLCFETDCNEGTYTLSSTDFVWSGTDTDGCDLTFDLSK